MARKNEDFEPAAYRFLRDFKKFLKRYYGQRCPDYEEHCPNCKMWELYDEVVDHIDLDPENNQ